MHLFFTYLVWRYGCILQYYGITYPLEVGLHAHRDIYDKLTHHLCPFYVLHRNPYSSASANITRKMCVISKSPLRFDYLMSKTYRFYPNFIKIKEI